MSRQFNLQGGSQSDVLASGGSSGIAGLFQPGIEAYTPGSKDREVHVRIMPARDNTLPPNDASYPLSVLPYRDRHSNQLDTDTKTHPFNPWYQLAIGFTYIGKSMSAIMSPQTLRSMGEFSEEEIACPLTDCQAKARFSDNPAWLTLVDKDKAPDPRNLALPYRPQKVLMNAKWSYDNKEYKQGVLILTQAGLTDLKQRLKWPQTNPENPRDANWPEYLLGDITDPNLGTLNKVYITPFGSISAYCVHPTLEEFQLTGVEPMPLTEQELINRHDLGSSETLEIKTYQEIVDWMIWDGFLPMALIREACGSRANVPETDPLTYDQPSTVGPMAAPELSPVGQAPVAGVPQAQPAPAQPAQAQPAAGLPPAQPAPAQPAAGLPPAQPAAGLPPAQMQQPATQLPAAQAPAPQPAAQLPTAAPGVAPEAAPTPPDPNRMYRVRFNGQVYEMSRAATIQWAATIPNAIMSVDIAPVDMEYDFTVLGDSDLGPDLGAAPAPVQPAPPAQVAPPAQAPPQANSLPPAGGPPAVNSLPPTQSSFAGQGTPEMPPVADMSGNQPQPAGVPDTSGQAAAGPLSAVEQARLAELRKDVVNLDPSAVREMSDLLQRAS